VRTSILFILAAVVVVAVSLVTVRAANTTVPTAGQVAPTFTLPSQDGSQISLGSYHGKWVVLYFYPKDATPGCTIEAHNFQRDLSQYEAKNAVILGVSEDSAASHQSFCTKEGLTFHLLADTEHTVADAYGSLSNMGVIKIAKRNTFLIDPAGNIAQVWTSVDPSTHSPAVLAALSSLSVKPPATGTRDSVRPPVVPNSVKPPVNPGVAQPQAEK
jgi:peroxiredoxin Q/BCP